MANHHSRGTWSQNLSLWFESCRLSVNRKSKFLDHFSGSYPPVLDGDKEEKEREVIKELCRRTNWKAWLVPFRAVSVILSNPVGPFITCLARVTGADWEFSQLQHNGKIRFPALAHGRLVFNNTSGSTGTAKVVIEM